MKFTPNNITRIASLGGVDLWSGMTGASEANAIQKQNFEYNKWAQEQQWAREDSAMQRRIKDLQTAGLSPILATGSAGGAPSTTNRIERGYTPVNLMEAARTALALISTFSDISKTFSESAYIDTQEKGASLDNVTKAIDAVNSTQSGIGKNGGMVGDAIKSITGAGQKALNNLENIGKNIFTTDPKKSYGGVIDSAINDIINKFKDIDFKTYGKIKNNKGVNKSK